MKNIKYFFLSLLLIAPLLSANAGSELTWQHDGTIKRDDGQTISLQMGNLYGGLATPHGLFVIGYKIDKNGINYPYVARVSSSLKDPEYWPFNNDLQDLFLYKDTVHTVDSKGIIQEYKDHAWIKSRIRLEQNSKVVYTNKDIIACYPSALMKSAHKIGACYAVNKGWKITFNWRATSPKICGNRLHMYGTERATPYLLKVDIETGAVINKMKARSKIRDICHPDAG